MGFSLWFCLDWFWLFHDLYSFGNKAFFEVLTCVDLLWFDFNLLSNVSTNFHWIHPLKKDILNIKDLNSYRAECQSDKKRCFVEKLLRITLSITILEKH